MDHFRITRHFVGRVAAGAMAAFACASAGAVVAADMVTPGGSTATMQLTVTITTSLGTSSSSDTKTMATTGTSASAFVRNAPPFTSNQMNSMQINFANTTFNFGFFCIPFVGCAVNFSVAVSNLQFMLVQPVCSPIAGGGAIAMNNAILHTTGSYVVTGSISNSGAIDSTGAGSFTGRITNPTSSTVKLDQLVVADQTFVVPPDQLPSGVSAMTIVIDPTLTNTTLSGPFARSSNSYDADNDGMFDACDTCTDTDGDGYGNPGFPVNTCPPDNCPSVFNPDQLDANNNGIGDACEVPPCIADIAQPPNGVVNIDDLFLVINSWGACPQPCSAATCHADIAPTGGNCAVNVDDLFEVINHWGPCP